MRQDPPCTDNVETGRIATQASVFFNILNNKLTKKETEITLW